MAPARVPEGAHRRAPRAAAALALFVALLAPALPTAATADSGGTGGTGGIGGTGYVQEPYPVGVTLSDLTPAVPRPGETLTVTGTLDNHGARQIVGAHLGVRVGEGTEITGHTEQVASLTPGQSLPFTFKIPVSALGLTGTSDYRFAVGLAAADGRALGEAATELPWYVPGAKGSSTGGKRMNVAAVWPLTDNPHMGAVALGEGGSAQPVFRDDDLASEFAVGGRLQQLVAAGTGLPVTWTVDPAVLDEAKAMAGGYRVAKTPDSGNPQDSTPGTGGKAAASWLASARGAVAGRDVVALPYADPDLASIAHRAPGGSALPGVLDQSVRLAGLSARSELGTSGRTDVAWPYGGALDSSVTALAERFGLRTFIASGAGLSTGTTRTQVQLGGGATALVAEPATRAVLSRDLSGDGDQLIARQQLLGDLLKTQQRDPRDPGGIVMEPPRQMSGETASVLSQALKAAQDAGFVKLVGLGQVGSDPSASGPSGPPSAQIGPPDAYPEGLSETELTGADLGSVAAVQPDLDTLTRVLSDSGRITDSVHRSMLRALSTGWRGDRQDAQSYARGVEAYIDASIASVHLIQKRGTITVAGNSASVPVTVANGLQQPLAGLELRVTSSAPHRLVVITPTTPVHAPAAANHTEQVRVSAHANGPVRVTAQLYTTANGRPWGDPMTFQVDISKVSAGAIAIVVGGVVLVLLAAVWKMRQARRKQQQRAPQP